MEVQVVGSTIVHAAGLPVAASAVPFTVFDKFSPDMHVACLYAFVCPTASNEVIKEGLVETLLHFPKLTGRRGHDDLRRPCIYVGGREGGALLVEATVASDLADHVPFDPSPALRRLHPPTEGTDHLLQVQLNRFRCGGLVVGATAHHHAADGKAMGNFFVAWGKSVRGLAIDPLPVHDWRRWLQPRSPPRCEFQHWGVDFVPEDPAAGGDGALPVPIFADPNNIDNISLHYTSKFIQTTLRAHMRERYTVFECLLAHLWRKITMARGLDGEQPTQMHISVNGRGRLKPPAPAEFFGNLVLIARPRAKAKELLAGGLEGAAKLIHEAVLRIGDDYFRSFVDFGSMNEGKDLKSVDDDGGNVMHPDVEVDSWLGLRFDDVDFGGGCPCAFAPTWIPEEGLVIFLPSRHHGGVNVIITLFQEHAKVFRTMSHSLD